MRRFRVAQRNVDDSSRLQELQSIGEDEHVIFRELVGLGSAGYHRHVDAGAIEAPSD